MEEDGVGKQVNKSSKGSRPWGSGGPLGPCFPGGLERRLRVFVVQTQSGLDGNVRSPGAARKKNKSINLSLLSIIYE